MSFKNKNNKYEFNIPQSLPTTLLTLLESDHTLKANDLSLIYHIVDILVYKSQKHPNNYHKLSSRCLKNVINSNKICPIFNFLHTHNIIDRYSKRIEIGEEKYYRLNPSLLQEQRIWVVNTKKTIDKKLDLLYSIQNSNLNISNTGTTITTLTTSSTGTTNYVYSEPNSDSTQLNTSHSIYKKNKYASVKKNEVHQYLQDNLSRFEFDTINAYTYIQNEFLNNNLTAHQYNQAKDEIYKLESKAFRMTILPTNMRVVSNYTSLPKYLRVFITLNDKAVKEIDLSNSQPLIFNVIIYEYIKSFDLDADHPIHIEAFKYKTLTENDKFYTDLEAKVKIDYPTFISKKEFKIEIFTHVFYAKKYYPHPITDTFKNEYGYLYDIILDSKKNNTNALAILLQNLESSIFIDKICRELMTTVVRPAIITIHDGIFTNEDNIELIEKTIKDVILREWNLCPTIKIK